MAHDNNSTAVLCACVVTISMLAGSPLRADDTATREELRQLKAANKSLEEQLRPQQSLIESLSRKVNQIEQSDSQKSRELDRLAAKVKDGYATAKPAGNFSLKAWHERLPSQTREMTVPETGEIKVDFTLGITILPKP